MEDFFTRRHTALSTHVDLIHTQPCMLLRQATCLSVPAPLIRCHVSDNMTFLRQVGDIVSIIDMPRAEETVWWRGKKGFEVRTTCAHYSNHGKCVWVYDTAKNPKRSQQIVLQT